MKYTHTVNRQGNLQHDLMGKFSPDDVVNHEIDFAAVLDGSTISSVTWSSSPSSIVSFSNSQVETGGKSVSADISYAGSLTTGSIDTLGAGSSDFIIQALATLANGRRVSARGRIE